MPDPAFLSLVSDQASHRVVGERVVMLPGFTLEILSTRKIELSRWDLKNLNDPYWRLYIPTHGEAVVWTGLGDGREEVRLLPGGAYLISPRTTISSQNPVPFGKWYIHFTLGHGADHAAPGVYAVEITRSMQGSLGALEAGGKIEFPWEAIGLVTEGLRQLRAEVWSWKQSDPRVERALKFMGANLNRKLTTEDIARSAGLSVRNLNHLFRLQAESTPMRALLEFRLDQACRLLRHSSDSIEQIASETGFPNRYYFSRMLKQHRGVSPAAYRKGQV